MKERIREILKEVFERETLVNSILIRGTINKATEKCNELFETEVKNISSDAVLADSLPLSELKQTLYEVNTLIAGWNATEAEWSEWDKEVQQKVNELQLKLDKKEAVNFR